MKQIYHPYHLWEDTKNGILNKNFNEIETENLTQQARELLCDEKEFYFIAWNVITKWVYASEQHLSNEHRNRQAWIGQASCCYKYKIPEHITKYAWRLMTLEQQEKANKVADKIISLWEKQNAQKIL